MEFTGSDIEGVIYPDQPSWDRNGIGSFRQMFAYEMVCMDKTWSSYAIPPCINVGEVHDNSNKEGLMQWNMKMIEWHCQNHRFFIHSEKNAFSNFAHLSHKMVGIWQNFDWMTCPMVKYIIGEHIRERNWLPGLSDMVGESQLTSTHLSDHVTNTGSLISKYSNTVR